MAKQTILTDEGLKNYEQELEYLKTVKRKEVAEKIKVALSFGDLSENSEYDEAKNDQAMLEARISQIESILKNAKIIDESELSSEHIHIGSKIKVYDYDFEEEADYQIIGSDEADPFNGKLSDESRNIRENWIGQKHHAPMKNQAARLIFCVCLQGDFSNFFRVFDRVNPDVHQDFPGLAQHRRAVDLKRQIFVQKSLDLLISLSFQHIGNCFIQPFYFNGS